MTCWLTLNNINPYYRKFSSKWILKRTKLKKFVKFLAEIPSRWLTHTKIQKILFAYQLSNSKNCNKTLKTLNYSHFLPPPHTYFNNHKYDHDSSFPLHNSQQKQQKFSIFFLLNNKNSRHCHLSEFVCWMLENMKKKWKKCKGKTFSRLMIHWSLEMPWWEWAVFERGGEGGWSG